MESLTTRLGKSVPLHQRIPRMKKRGLKKQANQKIRFSFRSSEYWGRLDCVCIAISRQKSFSGFPFYMGLSPIPRSKRLQGSHVIPPNPITLSSKYSTMVGNVKEK